MPGRPNHQRRYYLLLGLVFLCAGAYQVAFSISAIEFQRRTGRTERPFTLALDSDRFDSVGAPLSGAGVHPRDQLLELDGQRYTGEAQIARILAVKRSGDSLSLKVRRQTDATVETLSIPLHSSRGELVTVTDWIVFS